MYDLSVVIPARNEEWLRQTIENVCANKSKRTEIIAILDGYWPEPVINDHPDVTLIHHSTPIGQRAGVNEGTRVSNAKYIMKLDGHCAVDKGFDVKLMEHCEHDWTVIPRMYNLHAFNLVCEKCGHSIYQGPMPDKCEKCGEGPFKKEVIWAPRKSRRTDFMRFDNNMKFQYWKDYEKRSESKGDIAPLMSSVGACFFMERSRFWELGGMDEGHGSWGQFGTEVACKAWLSGGSHVVNKKTWFAHMFRTKKDFGFPYPIHYKDQEAARTYSKDLWLNDKWPQATRKLSWLIEKFSPVPDWESKEEKIIDNKNPLLSIIIPARNEQYLQATIDDIHKNFTTNYEIIVGLDDYDPVLKEHPRVRIFRSEGRIGMRPMINILASMSKGKYLMKTDAHCAFDGGYDQKLINICIPGRTVLGIRYELDVKEWQRKERTNCDFRYLSNPEIDELGGLRGLAWHEWKKKTKGQKVAESMSLSGSGWLMEKVQWDAWGPLDENHGTFGQEGAEIACRTWLSGGQLLINRDTWYAHWNRGKAPYALGKHQRDKSVEYSIEFWMNDKWPLQKYSFWWLIEKFNPPGWEEALKDKVGDGMRRHRQGTLFKGSRVKYRDEHHDISVDMLWDCRLGIAEPLKRWRTKLMYDCFLNVVEALKNGKEFTDEEIRKTQYYHYLSTHLAKTVIPQNLPQYLNKWDKYLIKKFRSGERLFKDIRDNGLKTPLEFYRGDKLIYFWKGYRRLVILKMLGIKEVPILTHIDNRCKQLPSMFTPIKNQVASIDQIAQKQFINYGGKSTDKYWTHRYTPMYDKVFNDIRNNKIKLLEIGVARGASLRLWHEAFPKADIYGIDKDINIGLEMTDDLDRIHLLQGAQQDLSFLDKEVIPKGPFDIIIDDCGHNPDNQIITFNALWPYLKNHGWYVIEDCYISFLKRNKDRAIVPNEMAKLVENIYTDQAVLSVQFYYNICFVQKGI